jgi:myo-inositol catabolism protein IolS
MDYVTLGESDVRVSRIVLGCWAFGGDAFWGPQEDKDSLDTVSAALEQGINFVDTAEGYGENGKAESVVGKALKGRRSRAVVATKAYGDSLRPENLEKACDASLARLQTDYIDLYYIHWFNPSVPVEETLECMGRLKSKGKIRAIGICNFGPKHLARISPIREEYGISVHQLPYSLFWRAIEYEILPRSIEQKMQIVTYSSLAQGLLTGAYAKIEDVPDHLKITRFYESTRVNAAHGEHGCEAEIFQALSELKKISAEVGIALPLLAVGWNLGQPGVSSVLVGARTPAEIVQNAKAAETRLDQDILRRLRALSEPTKRKLGRNPDMWVGEEKSRFFA